MHAGGVLYCTDGMCCGCSSDVCYHMYWRGEQLVAVIACSGSDATSCVSVCMWCSVCVAVSISASSSRSWSCGVLAGGMPCRVLFRGVVCAVGNAMDVQ